MRDASLVWGGDWNVSFVGSDRRATAAARKLLHRFVRKHKLQVPTAGLMHQQGSYTSIDHIALPQHWPVSSVRKLAADDLSDHDAYVVEFQSLASIPPSM